MKYLITLILSSFWIFSYSQEKVLPEDYRNRVSSKFCYYTKSDMKPFNGILKLKVEMPGVYQYVKIEDACYGTDYEVFNSKNELLYKGKYTYDKKLNEIISSEIDSVKLGKSQLSDKIITDSTKLVSKQIYNYYNWSSTKEGIKTTPVTGIIYSKDKGEIYSVKYKDGVAVQLITYYSHADFDSSNRKIPDLEKKESRDILFNENGNIYNSYSGNQAYPFIFTGQYIKWDQNGKVIESRNIDAETKN